MAEPQIQLITPEASSASGESIEEPGAPEPQPQPGTSANYSVISTPCTCPLRIIIISRR